MIRHKEAVHLDLELPKTTLRIFGNLGIDRNLNRLRGTCFLLLLREEKVQDAQAAGTGYSGPIHGRRDGNDWRTETEENVVNNIGKIDTSKLFDLSWISSDHPENHRRIRRRHAPTYKSYLIMTNQIFNFRNNSS